MTLSNIHHALGLHLHQPPGNLRLLIDANPGQAEAIIRCYERVPRYAARYADVARLHVGFSGVLLEQLRDPEIVDRYRHLVDLPAMLEAYRAADNIELIGMGYYHPIFPLIPRPDWLEQILRGHAAVTETFGRAPVGFWPPEMAFSMAMIPALVRAGYDYVVVDGVHVRPRDGISDIFRPYLACEGGVCLPIVPRDPMVSSAQESGVNPGWFREELLRHAADSPRPAEPRLVTTWSDGENTRWFREMHEASGFFGVFFAPYMEEVRAGSYPITPVRLSEYLKQIRPVAHAKVQTGAWSVGSSPGEELARWAGSETQQRAVAEVARLSTRYWALTGRRVPGATAADEPLGRARRLILEAETSCFLFWGEAWIPHLYHRTRAAERALDEAEQTWATGAS